MKEEEVIKALRPQAMSLFEMAMLINDNPVEAISTLQSALGAMIVTHAKDGRESALKCVELVNKCLIEGVNNYFEQEEATLQ